MKTALGEKFRVGIIQTAVGTGAWQSPRLPMTDDAARLAWELLVSGISQLMHCTEKPQLIVAPEFALPAGYEQKLCAMVGQGGTPVVVGRDLRRDAHTGYVLNQAMVIVPRSWPKRYGNTTTRTFYVGKTYPAELESDHIAACKMSFGPDAVCWLFDAGSMGRFAVAICYDIMDIERLAIYRGEIQHLIIVSYNQDVSTFVGLAETASKLLFCNVVISNTGHYGGSTAVTPFHRHYRRIRFQVFGPDISAAQCIDLPLRRLEEWQRGIKTAIQAGEDEFKSLPAGFRSRPSLQPRKKIRTKKI